VKATGRGARPGPQRGNIFDRETFDRERQLWLEQNIQNYLFFQEIFSPSGPEYTYQIIRNGEATYFRDAVLNQYTRIYTPGEELYTTKGRKDTLFWKSSIPITELYALIDTDAKLGKYRIYINYDRQFHYPSYLRYQELEGYLSIEDLVVNPAIPDESSATDPYPVLP
jgi:hypothetical protein